MAPEPLDAVSSLTGAHLDKMKHAYGIGGHHFTRGNAVFCDPETSLLSF